jgi:hypothetical protein
MLTPAGVPGRAEAAPWLASCSFGFEFTAAKST